MLGLQPYSNKTFGKGVERSYKEKGLYKISKVTNYFNVKQEIGAFYFNLKAPVETISNEFIQIEKPASNLASRFVAVPGKLTRQEYEHTLLEEGAYRVIITPSNVKFTNDASFITRMNDTTRGNWRVVFPWNGSKDKIGQVIVAEPEDILSHNVGCVLVDSQEQAFALATYLQTEEVNNILRSIKTTCTNAKKYFEYIPLPSFLCQ